MGCPGGRASACVRLLASWLKAVKALRAHLGGLPQSKGLKLV